MNQNTSDLSNPSDTIKPEINYHLTDDGSDNPPELSAEQVAQFLIDLLDQRTS